MKYIYIILAAGLLAGILAGLFLAFGLPFSQIKNIQTLRIVSMGERPTGDAESLKRVISEEFPKVKLSVDKSVDMPSIALNKDRSQYNADTLLQELNKGSNQYEYVIAVTSEPLFSPGLNFVFSAVRDNIGVITTDYLATNVKSEEQFEERLRKVAKRMVGTMVGLHPRLTGDFKCAMRFSNSLDELDAKGLEWCGNEKERLLKAQILSQ